MADHNIDSLNIKITSDARSANNALNTLERHLNSLAGSLNNLGAQSSGLSKFSAGVTELSTAMVNFKNSGIGTADFTRLVKNLGQLSTIDHAGIEATASSLDKLGQSMGNISVLSENASKVTEFTNAMSQLGRKGVSQAIENLPRLTDAFRELLITLNETPEIRQDVLSMTQALAEFVSGAKGYVNQAKSMQTANARIKISVGYADEALKKFAETAKRAFKFLVTSPFKAFASGAKTLASGLQSCVGKLKTFATHSERAEKTASKFAQTVGTLYVKFWLLARVMGKLWSSVKSSFDYLETVNYFTSSFEAIAKKATTTMSDAGEASAEAYFDSFVDTAKSLTRKMTGFDISGGNLTMVKGSNLGLDPNTTLNYQTTFAQISSSMGVASDKAVILSNVLTEIGADLASVKNMEFEEVWQNMASGLVGMSRAVDKFGINIRASAMDEKLLELGINKTSKELSQADKALLRTIIILDSAKYAWGDLADTLDTPANQIRMLTANLHKLATMFGSLFLPILKKVLPYINALVIALQRLMQTLMGALGIDLSDMLPKGGGGASDALSDVLDESEDLGESLDDAQQNAKKLKNNLLGIDELNILNDNSDSSLTADDLGIDGLLDEAFIDAVSEYQKAWDEAFKRLENKAQDIADKIVAWAQKVWKPIGEAWDAVGDKVLEKWKYMTGELGKLFKSIASDWAEVWAQDKTEKIFEHLFSAVANILEFVGNLARQFRLAWDEADKGKKILETVRDIILKIAVHIDAMTKSWAEWAGKLNFNPILESLLGVLKAIKENADSILGIFDDFQTVFLQPALKYAIEEFFPRLLDIMRSLVNDINWERLRGAFADLFSGLEKIYEFLGDTFLDKLEKLEKVVADLINTYLPRLGSGFKKLGEDLQNAKDINDVIDALFDFGEGRVIDTAEIINKITKAFNDAFEKIDFKNLGKRIGGLINKIFENIDWQGLGKAVSNIAKGFFEIIHGALKEIKWFEVGQAIGNFLKGIDWGKIIKEVLSAIGDILGGLISAWFGSLSTAPLETGIITAIAGVFLGGKVVDGVLKLVSGKGLGASILGAIFGGNDDMGKEVTLFDKITGSAKNASESKGLFADANVRVADTARESVTQLADEGGKFAGLSSSIGGFLQTLGGITAVVGGVTLAGFEFGKQWSDGVTLANSALMGLGVALAGIGAVLLGAPAAVAAAVAGAVFVIGEGILLIHEHWDEIKAWWNNTVVPAVSGFFEGLGEKFREFGESVGEHWENLKTTLGEKWTALKEGFSTFVSEWGEKIHEWASTKWEDITNKVEEIRANIQMKWEEMKENFATHIENWRTKIGEWASTKWEDITNKLEEIRASIQEKWTEMQQNFTEHIGEWHNRIVQWSTEKWDEITNKVAEVRDYIKDRWHDMQEHFAEHINNWRESITEWASSKWEEITSTMDYIKGEIYDRWQKMKADFDEFKQHWREKIVEWASEKWDAITDAMSELKGKIQEKWEDYKRDFTEFLGEWKKKIGEWASEKWDTVVATITTLKDNIKKKWDEIHENASTFWGKFKTDLGSWAKDASEKVASAFSNIKDKLSDTWSNIKEGASKAFDKVKETAESAWNNIKDTVGNVVDNVSSAVSISSSSRTTTTKSSSKTSTKSSGVKSKDEWWDDLLKRAGYATGGFPEDGLFFANHNELVGSFKGRTAVANNQQITDGIAQATYQAIVRANSESNNREEQLLEELISAVREGRKVSIDGREIVAAYDSRKARNGYSFAQ